MDEDVLKVFDGTKWFCQSWNGAQDMALFKLVFVDITL